MSESPVAPSPTPENPENPEPSPGPGQVLVSEGVYQLLMSLKAQESSQNHTLTSPHEDGNALGPDFKWPEPNVKTQPSSEKPRSCKECLPFTMVDHDLLCKFKDEHGKPCQESMVSGRCDIVRHILQDHIERELKGIKARSLKMEDAQILVNPKRVERAEDYMWQCPKCEHASMALDEVEKHMEHKCYSGLPQLEIPLPDQKAVDGYAMTILDALDAILAA